ncbi:MAG: MMPL family transporter [Ornithinimicrobium sp.]
MLKLSDWVVRARYLILVGIFALAGVAAVLGLPALHLLGGGNPDFITPDSPSQRAVRSIEDATGTVPDGGLIVLVESADSGADPTANSMIDDVVAAMGEHSSIAAVIPPGQGGPRHVAEDRSSAYVLGLWDALASDEDYQATVEDLAERFEDRDEVLLGGSEVVGNQVVNTVVRDLARAELFAFPVLFVLSVLVFRGLVAAILPLVLGGLNIVLALGGLRLVNEVSDLSIFALNLVSALGLGLAIDYCLLIISRFRAEMAEGRDTGLALRRTMETAGKTVLLSSLTVAAAMACLFVFQQRFLYSMAVGGVLVAFSGMLVALVVLPALLAVLGKRIDSLAVGRWWGSSPAPRHARGRLSRFPDDETSFWFRLAQWVVARPARTAAGGVALLLLMALPLSGAQATAVSAKDVPESQSSREVDERLSADYLSNPREDVVVVAQGGAEQAEVQDLPARFADLDGVASVTPAVPLSQDATMVLLDPDQPGMAQSSQDLVRDVRALSSTELPLEVAGETANFVDLQSSLLDRLPLAAALVVAGTMIVLWLLTGSVLLPFKAVLLNVLTLAATFGLLVVIFQEGFLGGILDFEAQTALDVTMPVLLFALVFGLSTDYGVFLLARIREYRESGADDQRSIILGVGQTGRIVTAAAVLFCVALGALVTSDIVFIKELGLGTALGVLIDATIVRAMLVPSLMALLGRWAWWSPAPLTWLHDRIGVREGEPQREAA